MSNNVDRKIKDSLNKDIEKIPRKLDSRIENTLQGLKRKKNYKKQVAVASIVIASFVGLGVGVESYATRNKVQSDIFDEFYVSDNYKEYGIIIDKELHLETAETNKQQANSTNKEEASEDKEIQTKNIILDGVVYDGRTISMSYEVKGLKDELEEVKWDLSEKGMALCNSQIGRFKEDDGVIRGVVTSQLNSKKKELNLEVSAEINGSRYVLDEAIKVVSNKEDMKEVKINKELNGVKIKKLIITPIYVYLEGKPQDNLISGDGIRIETLKGEELQWDSSEASSIFGINNKITMAYTNDYKNVEGIRIIGQDKKIVVTDKGEVYEEEN